MTTTPETAAPLDALLVDAAIGPFTRWAPGRTGVDLALGLARRPHVVARRLVGLGGELGRVAAGTSQLAPSRRDRRFADEAWTANPFLRRALQAYLATGQTALQLVDDAQLRPRSDHRVRFIVENVVDATSPSNLPFLNPSALHAAVDSGGANFLRGARNLTKDLARAPRVPSMVDSSAFEVGRNVAATPGSVVLRTPMFELIQYAPQTEWVRELPLLVVPPTINKFYVTDIAPERSMIEHFVRSGQQVFVISWRNPDARHSAWGLDAYAGAVLDAQEAAHRICRVARSVLFGLCSGGIIASLAAGHLAATGRQDRLAGFTLGVTVLDQAGAGTAGALLDRRTAAAAAAVSARRGYLDGRNLAEMFAWLRPGDLIWNYWVNNYLLGKKPPAFDVLFWNADTTRMPATLHRDFLDLGLENKLVTPGKAIALGTPVDLSRVTVDSYVVAGISDHITPWQNCYRSTQLLGGDTRFVLSTSGHIAALVNPPGNNRASFQVNAEGNAADAAEWLRGATTEQGSWWPDFVAWLSQRSGPEKPAPSELGGAGMTPLVEAPGTYVFDK